MPNIIPVRRTAVSRFGAACACLLMLGMATAAASAQETGKRQPEPPPPKTVIAPCVPAPLPPMMRMPPGGGDPAELARSAAGAEAFLQENAKKPGVISLPSGIQYRVLATGDARSQCPMLEDYIKIHYEGSLADGTVFDSSMERKEPAIFNLSEVIPGYGASLPYMHVGDEWVIYVPPGLGYGERGAGGVIPPNAVLVFRIKLLGLLSLRDDVVQATPPAPKK